MVYRLAEQKRKTGSVKLRTSQRGRKPVLTAEDKENIRNCIDADPGITIEEIREKLNLSASYFTVERAINAMGYTLKKKSLCSAQASVTAFDVQEKRKEWKETITPEMVEHLVFLDESGVNTDLTRLYGRAPSSRRAVDHAPLNTPRTTTVLSSIRLDGEKAFTTCQGGTTGERFVRYLKETLFPALRPGGIVVMDNMRSHHVKVVRGVLEEKGMKAILRKWKIRRLDLLPDAIQRAHACVSQLDCLHWFAASTYC
ncbi:transposase [uncultured Oscillibacter sp.]|uniref:transposase n=1 Tax=uncultured Oscillibacter sp. TaxID=876091 RepID=UPI002604FFB1|nr:transposase [uncultured Oscillibacter sp.]